MNRSECEQDGLRLELGKLEEQIDEMEVRIKFQEPSLDFSANGKAGGAQRGGGGGGKWNRAASQNRAPFVPRHQEATLPPASRGGLCWSCGSHAGTHQAVFSFPMLTLCELP